MSYPHTGSKLLRLSVLSKQFKNTALWWPPFGTKPDSNQNRSHQVPGPRAPHGQGVSRSAHPFRRIGVTQLLGSEAGTERPDLENSIPNEPSELLSDLVSPIGRNSGVLIGGEPHQSSVSSGQFKLGWFLRR
jgi:hypothetical protein